MLNRILAPLDGSDISEIVFPWLKLLAEKGGEDTEILLLRAFEPPSRVYLLPDLSLPTSNAVSDEFFAGKILKYLEEQELKFPELNVSSHMVIGDPASEILSRTEEHDLIVMASHGRGGIGRWLLGSVTTKVARGADIPLLVVGAHSAEGESRRARINKILVPVDGSEAAERAFHTACTWAERFGAKLFLYQGVSEVELTNQVGLERNKQGMTFAKSYLKNLAASVESQEVDWEVRETYGRVGIAAYAEEVDADLIIMGSHGKGGLQRWLIGSQTERTLQKAPCPVLITH